MHLQCMEQHSLHSDMFRNNNNISRDYIPSLNPFVIKLITSLKFVNFCKYYVVSRPFVDKIKIKICEFLIYCSHYV